MNALVQSLAALGGLRDRDALDTELVRLVLTNSGVNLQAANLIRVVGEGDDRRCLSLSALEQGQEKPSRDLLWSDWSLLPKVSDFPVRQKALEIGRAAANPQDLGHVVLPVGQAQSQQIMLEVSSPKPLQAADIDLLQSILLAYQNLLGLLDYGERDSLTELLNRKTFDGAFFKATADQSNASPDNMPERRHDSPDAGVWLAVLDIDHFKRVNDNFGHLIGDEVLLLVARLMRSNFRFYDQLYRFGGEEFVILMRCESAVHAESALERFRERVQAYVFPQVGTITVSMGVSVLSPNDTPSSAFGRADKAVYYAKEHGRNQVCNYQTLVAEGKLVEQVVDEMDVDLF
ncbi:MAG: GGDEF domain-containing protein [Betaproteobacteria bacterium]|nr:GGDEF domain-containing protein [Betaproteobacteria bacterium]